VSALDVFSRNETVSEVSSSSLKFFLLPVILGDLNGKLVEGHDRAGVNAANPLFFVTHAALNSATVGPWH
jgi:TAP42-like family